MKLSEGQFAGLHDKLGSDGGYTVSPSTGEPITTGISVAPRDNEKKIPAAETSPGSISDYHADSGNQDRFTKGASFGAWRGPEGSDYLDTPTVYPNTPGGQSRARNQTVLSHQIAGFDLDKAQAGDWDNAELFNPFHPEGRQARGMESHEIAAGASPKEGESAAKGRQRSEWAAQQPEVQSWINSPRQRG